MERVRVGSLVVLILLLSLSPVFAAKVDEPLILTAQCTNSTYANLSYARYTSSSSYIVSTEQTMTQSGIFYSYTVPAVNNNLTGTVEYGYHCDVNGVDVSAGNLVMVNLIGEELTSGQGILYVVLISVSFMLFLVTVYGALAFPWRNNRNDSDEVISLNNLKYLKIVLYVFAYLEFLFIISMAKNLSGYLVVEGTYSFFSIVQTLMLSALLPFFPLLIFFTIVVYLNDKKTLKMIQRGIPVR